MSCLKSTTYWISLFHILHVKYRIKRPNSLSLFFIILASEANIINKKHDILGIFIPYFTSPVIIERLVLKFPARKLRRIKIHRGHEKHASQFHKTQMRHSCRGVTLYTNGVARATPYKKSATPSLRLPPHHLAPYTGRPRVMKTPTRTKERAHGQKVLEEARTDINRSRQTGGLKRCCPYC